MYIAKRIFLLVGLFALVSGFASAKDEDFAQIKAVVSKELGKQVTEIKPTPMPGLYQVIAPPMVFYMSKDARFIFNGDLFDMKEKVNLSEQARASAKKAALGQISEKDMIIYAPKKVKHVVTVFTDIDCPYCRKLHSEMAEYNRLGIEIRYLAYPRAGIGSESYKKAVAVWCAKDRKAAMDAAKNGIHVTDQTCSNPVAKEFRLGEDLGINGTPALVLENGQVYPGYAPPDQLIKVLDQIKSQVSMQ